MIYEIVSVVETYSFNSKSFVPLFISLEVYFLMDPWEYGDLSLVLPHDPQHASTLYPVSSTPTFPHSVGTAHGRCSSGQISWYRTNLGGQIILLIENLLNTQPAKKFLVLFVLAINMVLERRYQVLRSPLTVAYMQLGRFPVFS